VKIGIPRALFYYRYGRFWEVFFKNLGVEILLSPITNKEILEDGVKNVSSEVCLPIKILIGHIRTFRNVDRIFLPRFLFLREKLFACPKMIGVPDVARFISPFPIDSPKIKNNLFLVHFFYGIRLTKNPWKTFFSYLKARPYLKSPSLPPEFPPDRKKIGIISHFYNLKEEYLGREVVRFFTQNGFFIYTKDDLPISILTRKEGFAKNIRWIFERELYNAFQFYLDKVDGLVFIFSFGCGPDSLIGEIMEREAKERRVPFLKLVIDEHTGKAGIITRLEAFTDMIRRRLV
jgi:predicted nucleotide-binding protein (sugar kinase/HSP70/actin superfamily)